MAIADTTAQHELVQSWRANKDGKSYSKEGRLYEKPTTVLSGTFSTSGDNEIVAAPGADLRIVVLAFVIQDESGNAPTLTLRSAATTNGWRILAQNQGDGLSMLLGPHAPWKCNENEALNLNISANDQCGYSVMYYTEDM